MVRLRSIRWRGRSLGLALVFVALPPEAGARPVALELVLAVDSSTSVDVAEFALQMAGYAQAFRHPAVQRAIRASGPDGTLVRWADVYQQAVVVDCWMGDGGEAAGFADRIAAAGRAIRGQWLRGPQAGDRPVAKPSAAASAVPGPRNRREQSGSRSDATRAA